MKLLMPKKWWVVVPLSVLFLAVIGIPAFMIMGVPYVNSRILVRGALKGDPESQRTLGNAYRTGGMRAYSYGTIPRDQKKAVYWYGKAAINGDAKSAYLLADMYEKEFGGTKNSKAVHWYQVAAKQGNREASARLSAIFRQGLLDQKVDPKMADYWSRKARRNP